MSWPSTASRAVSSASAGVASRKWKVVPPSISIAGRGRWVSTKLGVWNGEFGPHHPFQSASSCQPGGPNLPAPMISADPRLVLLGERIVDAGGAPHASQDRGTE